MARLDRPAKRQRLGSGKARATATKDDTAAVLNHTPKETLSVFVFGAVPKARTPTFSPFLSGTGADGKPGYNVVQVACGGMHSIALTGDNHIITWGVNDNGALGRDTEWEAPTKDADDDDSDDNDTGLNPRESTPTAIPTKAFPSSTAFAQVAARDSCSFALTTTGDVYGWGSFRTIDGNEVFAPSSNGKDASSYIQRQTTPVRIAGLDGITQLAVGANHAMALDHHGHVRSWGCGDQKQLGYRQFDRNCPRTNDGRLLHASLVPHRVWLPRGARARAIFSGEYHSFAVDTHDRVWAWGLDSFGETGADLDGDVSGRSANGPEPPSAKLQKELRALAMDPRMDNQDPSSISMPTEVRALAGQKVVSIAGGGHHSVSFTADGKCLAWGRIDTGQLGISYGKDDASVQTDAHGRPAICKVPTVVPLKASDDAIASTCIAAACGTDHTILVTTAAPHAAFATGFNEERQLGLGRGAPDELMTARVIGGETLQGRTLTWAGVGGQFSMVAGPV